MSNSEEFRKSLQCSPSAIPTEEEKQKIINEYKSKMDNAIPVTLLLLHILMEK